MKFYLGNQIFEYVFYSIKEDKIFIIGIDDHYSIENIVGYDDDDFRFQHRLFCCNEKFICLGLLEESQSKYK